MNNTERRTASIEDKAEIIYKRFDERMREALRPLITEELIEEHKREPLGQHSGALERVLNYFRRAPVQSKYVIICTKLNEEWAIGRLSGVSGEPPKIEGDARFGSLDEAYHGVFLKRMRDLMGSP